MKEPKYSRLWLQPTTYLKSSMALLAMAQLYGCTTFRGEYADPNTVEIIDDKWNETDSRVIAEKTIQKMLGKGVWLQNFTKKHQSKPIVVVGDVENRTDEHIDTKALVSFISDELINSGKVRFVDGDAREAILAEMKYQTESGEVKKSAARKRGKQIGAHFLLMGFVSSNVQAQKKLKVVTYQIQFRLTDLESSEILWSHKELLKKRFRRGKVRM